VNSLIRVTCLGDIAPIHAARDAILESPRSLRNFFDTAFADSDMIFANFEAPVSSAVTIREDKKYVLKTTREVLGAFPDKMIFSIANNHILDYGNEGLIETIENLSETGMRFTGAGRNLAAAGKPVVTECRGRTVGFVACADSRYQAATEDNPGVFPAVPALLLPKITKLKADVDLVYVSIHMGMEYVSIPSPYMQQLAGECHLAGADVVFYHHAHCVSGYAMRDNGATLWGLGNFIFPESETYPFKPWFEAASWRLTHDLSARSLALEITPYLINKKGLPEPADKMTGTKILGRIAKAGKRISSNKNLGWARLHDVLSVPYLKTVFANYADMARRRGYRHVVRQMISFVKMQFLKTDLHDHD